MFWIAMILGGVIGLVMVLQPKKNVEPQAAAESRPQAVTAEPPDWTQRCEEVAAQIKARDFDLCRHTLKKLHEATDLPEPLARRVESLRQALLSSDPVCRIVLKYLPSIPGGTPQSKLTQQLDGDEAAVVRYAIYFAECDGRVTRQPQGRTYLLFPADGGGAESGQETLIETMAADIHRCFRDHQRAQIAAQFVRARRTKRAIPYLKLTPGPTTVPCPVHADGYDWLYKIDSPYWADHPLRGHPDCGCGVRGVSKSEFERMSKEGLPEPYGVPEIGQNGKRTGHTLRKLIPLRGVR